MDLTLTGVVGAHLAPTRALATVPFALIPVVAASSTFLLSRGIGRYGYRRVFTLAPLSAVLAGIVSAAGVYLHLFWLFCIGTALVGVYAAGAGYYRYAAAESNPDARAKAVSAVLAGGLVAALVGPFLATAAGDLTTTPYVASYLLVAVCGALAMLWNARLPRETRHAGGTVAGGRRPRRPLPGEAVDVPRAARRGGRHVPGRGRDDVDDDRRAPGRDGHGARRGQAGLAISCT